MIKEMFITKGPADNLFRIGQDGLEYCAHEDAYIVKACCPTGSLGCNCQGRDSVICPADDCTGILDSEVTTLFERLGAEYEL